MPITQVSLGSDSNPSRYKQGGSATLINCYREDAGKEAKAPWHVYPSDGLQGYAVLTSADGGVRAQINVDGLLYVVAGTRLYTVSDTQIVTLLGSMNISTTAPVYIERNRRTIPDVAIVCDGLMYYSRNLVLAQVTDVDLLSPTSLTFVDGYFVIGTANNTWQIGQIDDASAWDGLDFTRADANPDAVITVNAQQSQAMIFGEVSTEFHRNTGAADFPFERVTAIDIGCLAAGSVQRLEQTIAWVANDRTVRMLNGYTAQRVSTHAVERDIESLVNRSTIRSCTWVKDGHTFYSISSTSWTWVFDTVTSLWHKRMSYGQAYWRIATAVFFDGKLITGDLETGTLYEMSAEFTDEAGDPLVSEIIIPPVHAFPARLRHNTLYIDMQRGVGTGTGEVDEIAPVVMVSWSEDGGETFGNERQLQLGEQGKNLIRVRTHRLGIAPENGRVYKLSVSAKVRRGFYGLTIEADKLAA